MVKQTDRQAGFNIYPPVPPYSNFITRWGGYTKWCGQAVMALYSYQQVVAGSDPTLSSNFPPLICHSVGSATNPSNEVEREIPCATNVPMLKDTCCYGPKINLNLKKEKEKGIKL